MASSLGLDEWVELKLTSLTLYGEIVNGEGLASC